MASNFIIKYQSNKRETHEDKDKDLSYVVTSRAMVFGFLEVMEKERFSSKDIGGGMSAFYF